MPLQSPLSWDGMVSWMLMGHGTVADARHRRVLSDVQPAPMPGSCESDIPDVKGAVCVYQKDSEWVDEGTSGGGCKDKQGYSGGGELHAVSKMTEKAVIILIFPCSKSSCVGGRLV